MNKTDSHNINRILNKDSRKVVKAAVRAGCTTKPGRKHVTVLTPGGGIVIVSTTPSGGNAHRRIERDFRKLGVSV